MAHRRRELCDDRGPSVSFEGSSGSQGLEQREPLLSSRRRKAGRDCQRPDPALAAAQSSARRAV